MEGSAEFLQQLTEALEKRGRWLQGAQIPGLKAALQSYQSLFESIMGMLIRKGLLREDPYNYEQSIKDITVPSDEPLPEFENTDETSYRLAEFRRQLKFVVTEADFSLSSLSLARLKKISALYSYVNWSELGDNSTSPITRSFGRAFMKILLGADAMAAQILKDQETQIVKVFHDVRSLVADLVGFHRESWKAEVRRTILPRLMLAPGQGKKEETFRAIRKAFQKEGGGRPWYPALAQEIIAEELESDAAHRKEKLLASLAIPAPDAGEDKKEADARPLLMEAVRILSRPHEELVTAVESLSESERLLKGREGGIGQTIKRLFRRSEREKADSHTYEIQYAEPAQGTTRTEKVDFPSFAEEARKKATLLASIAAGTGPAYKRLEGTKETILADFVDKQINELLLIHRRLASFNTFFQAKASQSGKQGVRGIKLELLTLRNSLVKANQRRHEYGERTEGAKKRQANGSAVSAAEKPTG